MAMLWRNWSGLQQSYPQAILNPKNRNDLVKIIQSQHKLRIVGAGHSFSPLVKTDEIMISLDHFQGLIKYDADQAQAEVWAGTRMYQFPKVLDPIYQGLMNQGDIDQQSIAGAISTGTHGTGASLPCLSALVKEFELLNADGSFLTCSEQKNSEIFQAGRVALGSLGVITKLKLQNRPRYKLKEQIRLCAVKDLLSSMDTWRHQHRHIECFIFAFHDQAILKTLDDTEQDIYRKKEDWLSEDTLLTFCCEITRKIPKLAGILQKLVGVFITESTQVDWSGRIFPSQRNTKFNEMEYQIPLEQGMQCLEEIIFTFKHQKLPVFFPIEVRYVKADDIWISPFYQQDSLSISIHQYIKQDCWKIFSVIEPILRRYGGRPHWGKLHTLTAKDLCDLYPKWQDFQSLRQQLDPQRKFLNPYLQQIFIGE